MSEDLVKRLRLYEPIDNTSKLISEAADEIERLKVELAAVREIERLQTELIECQKERDDALATLDANWVQHQRVVKAETALAESRANDRCAMGYLSDIRSIVGGDDYPAVVEAVKRLCEFKEKHTYKRKRLEEAGFGKSPLRDAAPDEQEEGK